jgi:hypothetical protein
MPRGQTAWRSLPVPIPSGPAPTIGPKGISSYASAGIDLDSTWKSLKMISALLHPIAAASKSRCRHSLLGLKRFNCHSNIQTPPSCTPSTCTRGHLISSRRPPTRTVSRSSLPSQRNGTPTHLPSHVKQRPGAPAVPLPRGANFRRPRETHAGTSSRSRSCCGLLARWQIGRQVGHSWLRLD